MGNQVRHYRKLKKLTQQQVADAIGMHLTNYNKLENGKSAPDISRFEQLAKVLDTTASALLAAEIEEPRRVSDEEEWREDVASYERVEADGIYSSNAPYTPRIAGAMPELDLEAGAGEGREGEIYQLTLGKESVSGHRVVAEWKFSDEWIRSEVRASSKRTVVLPVIGDSMEPNFRHGDRVLVDHSQTEFIDGVVFVISVDEGAPSIKRLAEVYEVRPRKLTIISDNAAIPNRDVPASIVTIIGRVVGKVSRQ